MGDNFLAVVPLNVSRSASKILAEKTINWLVNRGIVKAIKTNCIFGIDTGFPPGDQYNAAIDGEDVGLLRLTTNGLGVITTRQVFDNGGHGIDSISCPDCGENIIDSDWGALLDEWVNETGKDNFGCPACGVTNSITHFKFDPTWAFGELGFVFWNWPSFNSGFVQEFEAVIGRPVALVYGRL